MRHTFRETLSGLKRNMSMTIAVIVTMTVSLTLFGLSLMTFAEVDQVKGRWYDKIEISVFLCTADSAGTSDSGNCEPGQETSEVQRENIKQRLESNPDVETVYYESKQDAYDAYRETYADSPLLDSLTVDQMQDSFRVKLVDPTNYQGVVAEASSLPGVQKVLDLHQVLDPIFSVLNGLKWGTMGMAGCCRPPSGRRQALPGSGSNDPAHRSGRMPAAAARTGSGDLLGEITQHEAGNGRGRWCPCLYPGCR